MSRKGKGCVVFVILLAAAVGIALLAKQCNTEEEAEQYQFERVEAELGTVQTTIDTIGEVQPQNRLAVTPPINGRIDEILVDEGDTVVRGQILARLSSTERAALLDAATAQGDEALAHWQDVYKPTPLIAPIDGQVIVRGMEPGQTVSPATPIIVISDRLIVRGFVDETDIGQVRTGQTATVTLDAYPHVIVNGIVDHISYEARVINNVVVYEVEIVPDEVPDVFRSGMSAALAVVDRRSENVCCIPIDAVEYDEEGAFVRIAGDAEEGTLHRVQVGLTDGINAEITEGLKSGDMLVVRREVFALSEKKTAKNPFMPSRKKDKDKRK